MADLQLPENSIISKTLLSIDKYKSLDQLKQAVIENEYSPANGKFIRSLLWKSVFITESLNIKLWANKLSDSRRVYHQLIKGDDMIIPWYKLEIDSPYYQPIELSRNSSIRKTKNTTGIAKQNSIKQKSKLTRVKMNDDPLSKGDESKGETSDILSQTDEREDTDLELLKTIILDAERLFPGEKFFNDNKYYRQQVIEVLYVWCKYNNSIGYKQGFHEILGLIYMNIRKDSITIPKTNTISSDDLKILNLYDMNYLCHDIFTIFNKFMVKNGIISNYYENENVLLKSIESFNKYLMKVDQLIHYNLISKLKVESQLWCIRYFRLMLLREIGHDLDIMTYLWDKIIVVEGNKVPNLLTFLIIVLLINLKSDLIICDFSEGLSLLLHYPTELKFDNVTSLQFVNNLFKDSLKLLSVMDNDLKLYELGMKINERCNPDLKISLSFNGRTSSESMRSRTASPIRKISSNNSDIRPSFESTHSSHSIMGNLNSNSTPNLNSNTQQSQPSTKDSRAEKMAFEKYRLEMRLKKKAQLLMRP